MVEEVPAGPQEIHHGRFLPNLELLHERVLPAVTATFSATGGILRVVGDELDNTIVVSRDAAGTILVNNGAIAIQGDPGATVVNTRTIMLTGAGGNDNLSLDETNGALPAASIFGGAGNDVLTGGSGDDFVDGGTGSDTVFLGAGDDMFQWNPGDGSDVVDGQGGRDTLVFNGSDAAEKFNISANGSRVRFTRDVGNVTMDLNGVEHIDLNALGGADTITVNDTTATDLLDVNLDLHGSAGTGDSQADAVIINGTAGADIGRITSSDGSSISAKVNLFPVVNITGAEVTLDTLTVNALGGNDTVDASSLPFNLIGLTLNGGAGNDTLIGSQGDDTFVWNPGDGSDLVDGQAGGDTLVFNGSDAAEKFAISANGSHVQFTRDVGNVTMDINGVEEIDLNALGGADIITVNDTSATDLSQLDLNLASSAGSGDGQDDVVILNGTEGDDVIQIAAVENGTGIGVDGLVPKVDITGADGVIDTLTVNALGGNDVVDASNLPANLIGLSLNGGAGNDTILGSPGDDLVTGGPGNDMVQLGAGRDTFVWNPGDGSDTVDGQGGSDRLVFNGSDAAEKIAISANGSRVQFTRDVGNVTMDLNGIETLDFNALGGADTITVNDTAATDLTAVNLNLNNSAGTGDGQADAVVINGTNGDDSIQIAAIGNGSNIVVRGLSPQVNITGADGTIDTLTVNALGGNDVVDASSLPANLIGLTVNLGDGQADANTRFVDQLYQDLLGRQADTAGLAVWQGQLAQGLMTRTQVTAAIENSTEFLTDVVQKAYRQFLRRTGDQAGVSGWVQFIQAGHTIEQMEAGIVGSAEYFQVRGGGTNTGFLTALYQDALGRTPDAGGLAGFTMKLTTGATTGQVAALIFGTQEFQQDLVQSFYAAFLGRAADSAGLNSFVASMQHGATDQQIVAAIAGSDEFFARL